MPNEVCSALKEKGLIGSRIISAITDYDVHTIWLAKCVDVYCVACEYTKDKLKTLGVPEGKIRVTGIPSDEKFSGLFDIVSNFDIRISYFNSVN